MLETHVQDITRVIQLAVAPVFLLTAVGSFLAVFSNRLSRIVDRSRALESRQAGLAPSERQAVAAERHQVPAAAARTSGATRS